jgi:hypothetical protein
LPQTVKSYIVLIEVLSIVGGIIVIAISIFLIYRNCKKEKLPPATEFFGEERVIVRYRADDPAVIQDSEEAAA